MHTCHRLLGAVLGRRAREGVRGVEVTLFLAPRDGVVAPALLFLDTLSTVDLFSLSSLACLPFDLDLRAEGGAGTSNATERSEEEGVSASLRESRSAASGSRESSDSMLAAAPNVLPPRPLRRASLERRDTVSSRRRVVL